MRTDLPPDRRRENWEGRPSFSGLGQYAQSAGIKTVTGSGVVRYEPAFVRAGVELG